MVAYATGVSWLEAQEGTAEDLRWRGASAVMQATASMGMPRGKASLNTRPPLARPSNRGSAWHRAMTRSECFTNDGLFTLKTVVTLNDTTLTHPTRLNDTTRHTSY